MIKSIFLYRIKEHIEANIEMFFNISYWYYDIDEVQVDCH